MHVDETPVDDVRVVFRQGLRSAGASATRARMRPPGRIVSSVARHASLRSRAIALCCAFWLPSNSLCGGGAARLRFTKSSVHRSHFGLRYKLGRCGHAGLLLVYYISHSQ